MASIKNFGIQGVGSDVQFGKGGSRLVSDNTGNFRIVNASNTSNVRLTISNGIVDTDAVALGQLNALANSVLSNAATQQAAIDGLLSNATSQQVAIDGLTANAVAQQIVLDTLTSNAASQYTDIQNLFSNAVAQQNALNALANATSGSTEALQAEVDRIEAAVGLDLTGNIAAFAGTYTAGKTTVKAAIDALDAALDAANTALITNAVAQQTAIDQNTQAILTEVSRATAAEGAIANSVTAEVARATDAEAALANSVLIETIRAQGAEQTIANSVAAEVVRATGAEAQIASDLANAVTTLTNKDTLLQSEIDALNANVAALGSAFNYVGTLDGSETNLSLAVPADGGKDTGDYYKFVGTGPVTFTYFDSNNDAQTLVVNKGDGIVKSPTGWDKIDNTNSEVRGTTDFVTVTGSTDTGFDVTIANTFVQRVASLEGKTSVDTSDLQSQIDNLRSNATAESARIDGVDAAQNAALAAEANARQAADSLNAQAISDETTRALAAEAALSSLLANSVADYQAADAALTANLAQEKADRIAADNALSANVAALQSNAVSQQNEIDGLWANAASQFDALTTLTANAAAQEANAVAQQAQIDSLLSLTTGSTADLQAEIDRVEAAVGLDSTGNAVAFTGTYVAGSSTFKAAIEALDGSLKTTSDALAQEVSDRGNAVTDLTSKLADANAATLAALAGANAALLAETNRAVGVETSILGALANTDANAVTLAGKVTDLQAELDATQAGAGLLPDGSYDVNHFANYIQTATSLKDADDMLDAALKAEADAREAADTAAAARLTALEANTTGSTAALQAEIDAIEAGVGLAADGKYVAANGVYTSGANTVVAAIAALDAALKTEADAQVANAVAQQAAITATNAALAQETTDRANAVANAVTLLQGELSSNVAAVQSKLDAVNAAYTAADSLINANVAANLANTVLIDGSHAFTADQSMGGHKLTNVANGTVATDAVNKGQLDSAIDTVTKNVASLGNAFNYVGTLAGGSSANAATDLSTLAAGGKDAGDYYKVSAPGYFTYNSVTAYFNTNDGLVFNVAGGFDKIDNTDSTVAGTANFVSVTGSADTGYTVDLDAGFKARVATVEANTVVLQGNVASQGALISGLQTEVDAVEAAVGLNSNGTVTLGSSNYFGNATTLLSALKAVDAAVKANSDSFAAANAALVAKDTSLQAELDATQTGAGLAANGAYVANASSNYLGNAVSLADADNKLDAAIKQVQTGLATLSQDQIQSADTMYRVKTTNTATNFYGNVGGVSAFQGNVVTAAAQDSTFTLSTAVAGEIRLEAHSSTASNVDIRLVPQNSGNVIVGETGTNGIIQADDGYDLTIAGGDQAGGTAGNIILSAGAGTTNGAILLKDGAHNTILALNSADASVNATLNTTATAVVLGAAGSATNADIKLAPRGTGSVDASNARVVNVANAVAAQDAVTLSQLQSATSTAQSAATSGSLRAKTVAVTEATASTPVFSNISGEAVLVKVYVTAAFSAGATISVVASSAGTLASSDMVDEAKVGLYVIEIAPGTVLSNETINVVVTAGSGSTGTAKVFVEYLAG